MWKVIIDSPAYGYQFSIGMADDSGNFAVIFGERFEQAVPDFDFHD